MSVLCLAVAMLPITANKVYPRSHISYIYIFIYILVLMFSTVFEDVFYQSNRSAENCRSRSTISTGLSRESIDRRSPIHITVHDVRKWVSREWPVKTVEFRRQLIDGETAGSVHQSKSNGVPQPPPAVLRYGTACDSIEGCQAV